MVKMGFLSLVAVLCCAHLAYGALHTLQYFYTASSGISNFPEFVDVGVVDGVAVSRYDSDTQRKVPLQRWFAENLDQDYWDRYSESMKGQEQVFKANIETAKQRFNQTGGVHTFQQMYGCQWDDESQATDGFRQYGYDGEEFISLDLVNKRWIAPLRQSEITKQKWDANKAEIEYMNNYFTKECIDWLKKYVNYGSSTLGRKVAPEASLLPKGSVVACHATGFYPDGVMITWKKNGVEMEDDVDVGETLPNEDGTFQKRAVLTISPEEKKATYSCEVTHKSRAEPIVMVFEESGEGNNLPVIIGCVVAVAVLVGVVVAVVMMKKRGYTKASQSDTSSDNSAEPTKA